MLEFSICFAFVAMILTPFIVDAKHKAKSTGVVTGTFSKKPLRPPFDNPPSHSAGPVKVFTPRRTLAPGRPTAIDAR